jgi:hypothetical protein
MPGMRGIARHAVGLRVAVVATALLLLLATVVVIQAEAIERRMVEGLSRAAMRGAVVYGDRTDAASFIGARDAPGMKAQVFGTPSLPFSVVAAGAGTKPTLL